MSSFKRFVFLGVIGVILIFSVGCSESTLKSIYRDDYRIVGEGDSYNFKERLGTTVPNKMSVEFKKFYGMETIWIINAQTNGSITFDFDSKIKSGEFKAVLILPSNEILNIFEQSKKGKVTLDVQKGKNRVKIVGNDASGEVQIVPTIDIHVGSIKA